MSLQGSGSEERMNRGNASSGTGAGTVEKMERRDSSSRDRAGSRRASRVGACQGCTNARACLQRVMVAHYCWQLYDTVLLGEVDDLKGMERNSMV